MGALWPCYDTMRPLRVPAFALLFAVLLSPLTAAARGYTPQGSCGPHERVALGVVPTGHCVALVADERQGLRYPRRILEVAPGRMWVIDMGSWAPRKGRLLELTPPPGARQASVRVLAEQLDRPLGLAVGPDGQAWVGEAGQIWRMPIPPAGQPLGPREVMLPDLPSDGAHPLKEIAFGPGGALYVNMGSVTDACRNEAQQLPMPCPERSGTAPRAAVWRLQLRAKPEAGQSPVVRFAPYAVGLRNAMALAVLPDGPTKGSLWQGENGIDYSDAKEPPEELNRLTEGGDYGWPYCVGHRKPARGYEGRFDCRKTVAPHAVWPAHVAPLQLLATPLSSPFGGQLLSAWHGPGRGGQRVVGFARDARRLPGGAPINWLSGWSEQQGVRPRGRPTGIALDHAGRLLVVEDFNRSLLMLMPDGSAKATR